MAIAAVLDFARARILLVDIRTSEEIGRRADDLLATLALVHDPLSR
jgi:hypothetical protein